MSYLTPGRFRVGGHGASLDGLDDIEIRSILHRASAMVDQYCAVPVEPSKHDFRGGTIVDEEVRWDISGHELLSGQRRAYLRHGPVLSVESLRLDVSSSQYITFGEDELYATDHYVELTALNAFSLFGAVVLPAVGLATPVGRASYTYGYRFNVTGEVIDADDARQYRAMNQWWHAEPEPAVRVDGTAADPDDYTIDFDEGTVSFGEDAPLETGSVVSVDYDHRLPPAIAEATSMIAVEDLGERNLTRKGLHGLVELAVGEVRIRRDFPRAGVLRHGVSDKVMQLLDPYRFVTVRGS